jgi:hypothetical protein
MPDYRPTGNRPAFQGAGQASRPPAARYAGPPSTGGGGSTNLADLLERVLDKGIVIAGDIQINLLDIELLTIKIRLLIASVDRAKEMGINWWETDPSLTSSSGGQQQLTQGDRQMVDRLDQIEAKLGIEPPAEEEQAGNGGSGSSGDGREPGSGPSTSSLESENAELRQRLEALELRLGQIAGDTAPPPGPPTRSDLRELTVAELTDRARAAGVEGFSTMRKDELVAAVRSAEASAPARPVTGGDDADAE